jgi:hypothetical protein
MKASFAGAVGFFFAPTLIGLLFCAVSLFTRTGPGKDGSSAMDDFLLPAYLIVFVMTFSTLGFVITTALSPVWRGLAARKAMLVAAGLGMICPIAHVLGFAGFAWIMLPLIRATPWLAAVLINTLPGVLLGFAAILLAKWMQRRLAW